MSAEGLTLTANEQKLLYICFKHMEGIPNIDFEKVAEEYGYKDAKAARNRFNLTKNKIMNIGDIKGGQGVVSDEAKGSQTSPKRKAAGDTNVPQSSPKRKATGEAKAGGAKRGRKPKSASTAVSQESTEGDSEKGFKKETGDHDIKKDEDKVEEAPKEQEATVSSAVNGSDEGDEEA